MSLLDLLNDDILTHIHKHLAIQDSINFYVATCDRSLSKYLINRLYGNYMILKKSNRYCCPEAFSEYSIYNKCKICDMLLCSECKFDTDYRNNRSDKYCRACLVDQSILYCDGCKVFNTNGSYVYENIAKFHNMYNYEYNLYCVVCNNFRCTNCVHDDILCHGNSTCKNIICKDCQGSNVDEYFKSCNELNRITYSVLNGKKDCYIEECYELVCNVCFNGLNKCCSDCQKT
jgi:hypothetical protein